MSDRSTPPEQQAELAFRYLAGAAVALIAIGTIVYGIVENWTWIDSFYFSVIAVTTVGFGDITPSTDPSKLFTVFYIMAGISLIGAYPSLRMKRHARRHFKETD